MKRAGPLWIATASVSCSAILSLGLGCSVASCARAQQAATSAPPPIEVIGEWGQSGDGPGKLKSPASIATDADGLVYVADAGSGFVNKFDWTGQALASFNHPQMKQPVGIAVDSGGAVYVVDAKAGAVLVFYPDGRLLRVMRGGPKVRFRGPAAVAVDAFGAIYVVERDAARVQKFDERGRFVRAWGKPGTGPGEFQSPSDVAVAPDGSVYVADTENGRVQQFTSDGRYVAQWGGAGSGPGQIGRASGVAVSEKLVFVADSGNQRVQAWHLNGTLWLGDALSEHFRDSAGAPAHLAIGRKGELLVLDSARPRVLRVKVNLETQN